MKFRIPPKVIKYFMIAVSLIIFAICADLFLRTTMDTFGNKNIRTTELTNIIFAIFAASASLCFSYSKTLDPEEKNKIKRVRYSGECLFLGAIFFLTASGLKYVSLRVEPSHPIGLRAVLYQIVGILYDILFYAASFLGILAYYGLVYILARKYTSFVAPPWTDESDKPIKPVPEIKTNTAPST